jgi:exodeoxyribonuclease VII small subunit
METKENQDLEKYPFEKALSRLEEIVGKMEKGEMPLDEMVENFETGTKLADACSKKLAAFQKKIEILVQDNGENSEWRDFESRNDRRTP